MNKEDMIIYNNAKIKLEKIKQLNSHILYFLFLLPFIFLFIYYYFQTMLLFWIIVIIWTLSIIGHYFYVYDIEDFFQKKYENKHLNSILKKEKLKKNNNLYKLTLIFKL